jgi:hypothetical protein
VSRVSDTTALDKHQVAGLQHANPLMPSRWCEVGPACDPHTACLPSLAHTAACLSTFTCSCDARVASLSLVLWVCQKAAAHWCAQFWSRVSLQALPDVLLCACRLADRIKKPLLLIHGEVSVPGKVLRQVIDPVGTLANPCRAGVAEVVARCFPIPALCCCCRFALQTCMASLAGASSVPHTASGKLSHSPPGSH